MGYPWGDHDSSHSSWPTGPPDGWHPPPHNGYWTPSSQQTSTISTPLPNAFQTLTYNTSKPPYWETASSSSSTSFPTALHENKPELQSGPLAAAIVLPILALLSVLGLTFFFLRNRALRNRNNAAGSTPIIPAAMKEKLGSFRRHRYPPPLETADGAPIVTSESNNAYFTGLDTSSFGSRGNSGEYPARSSDEPLPPYIRDVSPPPPLSTEAMSVRSDQDTRRPSNPFETPMGSPVSPVEEADRRASDVSEMDRR